MKLILLVEDEYETAEVLELLLEDEGYRVVHAVNGRDALVLLAGEKPAVILSDFMMPYMSGGELGQAVRAAPALKDIPFVVMSGTQEAVLQASFCDYDAFIAKPYAAADLLKLLAELAEGGRPPPKLSASDREPSSENVGFSLLQLPHGIETPTN